MKNINKIAFLEPKGSKISANNKIKIITEKLNQVIDEVNTEEQDKEQCKHKNIKTTLGAKFCVDCGEGWIKPKKEQCWESTINNGVQIKTYGLPTMVFTISDRGDCKLVEIQSGEPKTEELASEVADILRQEGRGPETEEPIVIKDNPLGFQGLRGKPAPFECHIHKTIGYGKCLECEPECKLDEDCPCHYEGVLKGCCPMCQPKIELKDEVCNIDHHEPKDTPHDTTNEDEYGGNREKIQHVEDTCMCEEHISHSDCKGSYCMCEETTCPCGCGMSFDPKNYKTGNCPVHCSPLPVEEWEERLKQYANSYGWNKTIQGYLIDFISQTLKAEREKIRKKIETEVIVGTAPGFKEGGGYVKDAVLKLLDELKEAGE